MSSSSSTNIRTCYCGDRVGMWTSWTRKNPGRRFFGCPNYMDEEKDCGYFRWIDPPLLNKWYKERMYELGAIANGGVAIPFNNPVNEGEIPVDGPIAPVNVDVPIAPANALEPDNQIAMCDNTHVPSNEFGFCKWMMINVLVDHVMFWLMKWQYVIMAGQESFRSITRSYYRGDVGALLGLHKWCTLDKYNHVKGIHNVSMWLK
ncbi:uncharacterized protein LOC128128848 [Lactuca sativa]|uniref:uncharacterized protein LOC128128848 n=1 Tax=Lactuca sativa TaxID=4236 RepID=UPI0022AE98CD|nr:uncharacterized protein LOC128128848 [Lactuca sativa]